MNDNEYSAKSIHAKSYEALLTCRIRVFDRDREYVAHHLFCMRETDSVLPKIRLSFIWIEFDVHPQIMHIQCILSTFEAIGSGF